MTVLVYPRWRGELICKDAPGDGKAGLSPLARGTLPALHQLVFRMRFIPAGAGNSSKAKDQAFFYAVYPRWRGELFRPVELEYLYAGLSPLARGTQFWMRCGECH